MSEQYRNPFQEILSGIEDSQPITVYFTGDEEGPDRYGTVYDTEDEALEVARENDQQAWRVSVVPDWDSAVLLESDADGEDVNDPDEGDDDE